MSTLSRLGKGMLEGLGTGMVRVSKHKLEMAREEADRLHKENLARFKAGEATKLEEGRQAHATELEKGRQAHATELEKGRQAHATKLQGTKHEHEIEKEKLEGQDLDYDNSLHDDTMKSLNGRFATEVFSKVLGEGESSENMDAYMIQNSVTGVSELNIPLMRAKFPDMAAKYELAKIRAENELDVTNKPEQAVERAFQYLKSVDEKQAKAELDLLNAENAKKIGMTVDKYVAAKDKMYTSEEIDKIAEAVASGKYDLNDKNMSTLKEVQPDVYAKVVEKAKKSGGQDKSLNIFESGSSGVKNKTDAGILAGDI